MKYNERHFDLFSVPQDYYLAHCISADFALGAGIAAQIESRYHVRGELINTHPGYTFLYRREFGGLYPHRSSAQPGNKTKLLAQAHIIFYLWCSIPHEGDMYGRRDQEGSYAANSLRT